MRALASALLSAIFILGLSPSSQSQEAERAGFVRVDGTRFVLDGRPFRVAGVNNHYLTFGSDEEVRRVLDDAVAMNANVVRTFLQPVIGAPDGSVPTVWNWQSTAEASNLGVNQGYMLYWDPARAGMAVNEGERGMQRFDFLLAEASKRNLRLIVAFIDFWGYTGGAQQMNAWYGSTDKYTFFAADERTRRDYRNWVRHVLDRASSISGIRHADDPTIFAWDLANEPDIHPAGLLHDWLTEMSALVKELAPNQLVTSGHANMAVPLGDIDIPGLDFGTWHGYASYEQISHGQFDDLIRENCTIAGQAGKPLVLEEFGVPRSDPAQAEAYRTWLATIDQKDCGGWLVWRLVSKQDGGDYPVDEHDRFDIHNDGGPTWTVLRDAAARTREYNNSDSQ